VLVIPHNGKRKNAERRPVHRELAVEMKMVVVVVEMEVVTITKCC